MTLVSFTNSHDTGTMAAAGSAKRPMTAGKPRPRSKLPLYSHEFMQRPTTAVATTLPSVRTK